MTIRIELVIDGVVHYDKEHSPDTVDKKIETLKNYISRIQYKESYQLSKYIMSGFVHSGFSKLTEKQKLDAIRLSNIYPLKTVGRRYNVSGETISRYKKQYESQNAQLNFKV